MSSAAVHDGAKSAAYAASNEPDDSTTFTKRHATLICALLLFVATLGLYARSLRNDFINYDDPAYVTRNLAVQRGLTWSNVVWAFTSISEANWHPLTWLSHMADIQIFGLHPAGHHLHSDVLHAINVTLLFLLLWRSTASRWKSLTVAALFAVHPLNVESVAWIAERKSLLSTMFFLLGLAAYGWYVRNRSNRSYLAVAACFAGGLMAKPMVITFPFCLLLIDYWPLHRFERQPGSASDFRKAFSKLVIEKIPLFAMSVASAVITLYAQRRGGAIRSVAFMPLTQRFENAIYSYLKYLQKAIWPSDLAVFYPHPGAGLALWKVLLAAVILLGLSALIWRYRQRRYLAVGWLWFLGTMVPVIGLVQVGRQAMADRYAYLPFWGLFVVVVWLTDDLFLRLVPALKVAFAVAVCVFAVVTYTQLGYWVGSYTLFTHALQVTPDNAVSEANLGAVLADMGLQNQAEPHLEAAIRLAPDFLPPHYTLGMILQRQNRLAEAQREYQFVVANTSDPAESAQSHNNLGVLLSQRKQPDEAIRQFDAAIRINPNEKNSFLGRGSIEYQQGKGDAAVQDFRRAAQIAPSATTYMWLGSACELKKDESCAVQAYQSALRLNPGLPAAQNRLKILQGTSSAPAN